MLDFTPCTAAAEAGEDTALITILTKDGSAPRGPGAKMLVNSSKNICGTIGGGVLEAHAIVAAQVTIERRESSIQHIKLSPGDRDSIDMACGGDVNLLIEYISAQDIESQMHFSRLISYRSRQIASLCVTSIDNSSGELILSRGIYVSDGTIKGVLPTWVTEHLKPELLNGREYNMLEISKTKSILLESICQAAQIYIFGGGHVGLKTAQIMIFCGQRPVVVDDRPEFLDPERFPDCETYCCPKYKNVFEGRKIGPSTALVIVTRGHRYDLTVLEQALLTKAGYIGMIGSRSKISSSFNTLREKGFSSSDIARVHAPIGLSIGAETPSEIAVSIASEIISCFRIKFS